MTTPHQALPPKRSPRRNGARPSVFQTPVALCRALRRPLALAVATVAVAGVTADGSTFGAKPAGTASAVRPHTSAVSFTASPAIIEPSDSQTEADAALTLARRASAQRASALSQQLKVAAKARAMVLKKARKAAAARAARTQTRQDLIARAQSDPTAFASLLIADHGWGAGQFGCLKRLWNKESSWRWNADNPSSDAYGIPQSLPGSKMASFGSDWATNPITQIKWGLQYISDSYGTPCSAWAHSQGTNWY